MPQYIPDEVIAIATKEVGYLEKKNGDTKYLYDKTSNAGTNNYTKYGYEMHKIYPKTMDYPAAWCFTQGTMVLTDLGYKDISELKIGDRVLSADGTHFNNVVNVMVHDDDIYELKVIGTLPTYSTKEHPYLAKKSINNGSGLTATQFYPLQELDKGDLIALCMTKIENDIPPIVLDDCIKSYDKEIPVYILYANRDTKKSFLNMYLSINGYRYGSEFDVTSKELALGICKITTDIGYRADLFCKDDSKYTIRLNVLDDITDGYAYHCIESIEQIRLRDTVYNITTDGDHTYVANNMCVHNCDCFVDYCFYKAYGVTTAQNMLCGNFDDYTVNSAGMYKNKNAWYTKNPKVGDQIFFKNSSGKICHTGLVYKVDSSYVYTIEGNTSSASGVVANGGCVAKKKYALNYNRIAGYGRPKYSGIPSPSSSSNNSSTVSVPKVPDGIPNLAYGSKGDSVKLLQKDINYINTKYKMGMATLTVDGIFGPGTRDNLKKIQKKNGLLDDGIYGSGTRKVFLKLVV